jgi:hypothetical protein
MDSHQHDATALVPRHTRASKPGTSETIQMLVCNVVQVLLWWLVSTSHPPRKPPHPLAPTPQIFVGNIVLSVMWLVFGYTLSFGTSWLGIIGGLDHIFWLDLPYDK